MSILKVNAIQGTDGVERYTARAWVNFDGGGVPAIRASGNVSSITDNGVGSFTVNFASAMPDAYYSWSGGARYSAAGAADASYAIDGGGSQTTTALPIWCKRYTTLFDADRILVTVFR